jgi:hypothetical protein
MKLKLIPLVACALLVSVETASATDWWVFDSANKCARATALARSSTELAEMSNPDALIATVRNMGVTPVVTRLHAPDGSVAIVTVSAEGVWRGVMTYFSTEEHCELGRERLMIEGRIPKDD